jgi:invasion protein IalB
VLEFIDKCFKCSQTVNSTSARTLALGIPIATTSPSEVPITVIFKSEDELVDMEPKSSVANPVKPWAVVCHVAPEKVKLTYFSNSQCSIYLVIT